MSRTFDEIQDARNKLLTKIDDELFFFDVNKAGIVAPRSKNYLGKSDLGILRNEQAVMEAVYNILLTQPGDRVMNPLFGCDLNQYMFTMIDDVTARNMVREVYDAILNFEKRILDLEVIVTPKPDQNTFIIDIYLVINTAREPVKLTTTLEKVR